MKTLRMLFLVVVAVAAAVMASAHAQTLLLTLNTSNPQAGACFGWSVAVGDVNGDGKADIALGAPGEYADGNSQQGRAYVFSGANGSLLLTLDTPNPQAEAWFGWSVAVGDVNGDAKADIAVGTPYEDVDVNTNQGRAYVFSGANGSLLLTLDTPNPQAYAAFGYSLAVGEVNDDGKADIAVGTPGEDVSGNTGQGRAYVFSGADGSPLFPSPLDTPNPQAGAAFGYSLAMGEVNGDGKADIAVAAPSEDVGGNQDQGRAYVFSGADGSPLFPSPLDTPNPQAYAAFGYSLAMGEVNGDGKADIAVGTPQQLGISGIQGRAYVFSGADGSRLFTLNTPNPQAQAYFGYSVAVGDVNGDGKADIAVGTPYEDVEDAGVNADQGQAYVFSGADGSDLFTLDTPNPQESAWFGGSVAVGDVNGDGKADIAVGTPYEDVSGNLNQGRAYVFSQRGTIIVEKQTIPDGSPQEFEFTGDAAGTISDDEQITVTDLEPGTYSSTETVPDGWDLSDISCEDPTGDSTGDVGTATATFQVAPGETVKCTFTNTLQQVTPTPTPSPGPVGGIAELPPVSDSSAPDYVALAALAAVALVALCAGARYARRRCSGRPS